jgi:hypothetical protein
LTFSDTERLIAVLAERSGIPVTSRYDLTERPPATIETVAYFVISEAISNATKHSGAERIEIELTRNRDSTTVTVTDDGQGGADPDGRGLTGLAGRVAATDGGFSVRSPPGGRAADHTDEGLRAALEVRRRWPSVGVLVLSQYVEKSHATSRPPAPRIRTPKQHHGKHVVHAFRDAEIAELRWWAQRCGA